MKTFFKVLWSLIKGLLYAIVPWLVTQKAGGNLGPVLYLLYWSLSGCLWAISFQVIELRLLTNKEDEFAKSLTKAMGYSWLERIPVGLAGWVVLYSVLFN